MCEWICGKILPNDIDTPPALFVSGAATAVVVVVVKMDSGTSMFEKSMSTFALHNEMFSVRISIMLYPIGTQVELDGIVPHTA